MEFELHPQIKFEKNSSIAIFNLLIINIIKFFIFLFFLKFLYIILQFLLYRSTTPVLLPGKSHGRRSLVGQSPWGRQESDTTERLHFHFSFSCTGEGNGNPLQYSCLENPRDGGAWQAAIYGVAQSRTRLKRLSSSSSSSSTYIIKLSQDILCF